jgi:hypothetical protein
LRNSGGGGDADHVVKTGTGPQRVFHNIHHSGSAGQHPNKADGPGRRS